MNVVFEVLPYPTEPRVRACVRGRTVVWRLSSGWLCRCCGKARCRHIRAVRRVCRDRLYAALQAHAEWAL